MENANVLDFDSLISTDNEIDNETEKYIKWLGEPNDIITLGFVDINDNWGNKVLKRKEAPAFILNSLNQAKAVFIGLNELISEPKKGKAGINDIKSIRYFILDVDAERNGLDDKWNSTDTEKEIARKRIDEIKEHLNIPVKPSIIDSGNGWYLIYRLDTKDTDKNRIKATIDKVVDTLRIKYVNDTECSKDIAHVFGVPGTLNNNKKNSPDRPARLRKIVELNDESITADTFCDWANNYIKVNSGSIDFAPANTDKQATQATQATTLPQDPFMLALEAIIPPAQVNNNWKPFTTDVDKMIEAIKGTKYYSQGAKNSKFVDNKYGTLKKLFEQGADDEHPDPKHWIGAINSLLTRLVFFTGTDRALLNSIFMKTAMYSKWTIEKDWREERKNKDIELAIGNHFKQSNPVVYRPSKATMPTDLNSEIDRPHDAKNDVTEPKIIMANDIGIPRTLQGVIGAYAKRYRVPNIIAYGHLLHVIGIIVGRRIKIKIGEKNIKLALRQAVMAGSGTNKSGYIETLDALCMNIKKKNGLTFKHRTYSEITPEGFGLNEGRQFQNKVYNKSLKTWDTIAQDSILELKERYNEQVIGSPDGCSFLVDEAGGFLKKMTRYGYSDDAIEFCCSIFSDDRKAERETKGDGSYLIPDPCMSFFLGMVPNKFFEIARNVQFVEKGLVPRFLPVMSNRFKLELDSDIVNVISQKDKKEAENIIDVLITGLADKMKNLNSPEKWIIIDDLPFCEDVLDIPVEERGPDFYEERMIQEQAIMIDPNIKEIMDKKDHESRYQMLAKTAVQAKKIAVMHMLMENYMKDEKELKAKPYYKGAFYFVNLMHYMTFDAVIGSGTSVKEMDVLYDNICTSWKRHKDLSKLTIAVLAKNMATNDSPYRTMHSRLGDMLKILCEDGRIVPVKTARSTGYRPRLNCD